MTKIKKNFNIITACLIFFMAVINILIARSYYIFQPASYAVFLVLYLAVSITLTYLSVNFRIYSSKPDSIFDAFMPIFTLLYVITLGFVLELDRAYLHNGILYYLILLEISIVSSVITMGTSIRKKVFRFITCIPAGAFLILIGFITLLAAVFGIIGKTEINSLTESPEETYIAWVQVSDQGALGGDSCVKVRNIKKEFFTGLGTFKKRDAVLYFGGWGESYDLQWEDNNTLLVNGKKYNIPNFLLENRFDKLFIRTNPDIFLPKRAPDSFTDTHGGFRGEGETVIKYVLTETEVQLLAEDIEQNSKWKKIDNTSFEYLFGGGKDIFDDGFTSGKIPIFQNGYYCFYNKQTGQYKFPEGRVYSSNYIVVVYSSQDQVLYVYELDT